MPPKWPQKAKSALAYLFRPLQEIDVYVEDSNDTIFYSELFKRLAPANLRLTRVFPVGNRAAVIARAKSYDFSSRDALFVVDGDLEWVRGDAAPQLVYRLDAYCIENLLIHQESATQIVIEEAVVSEDEAKETLRFEAWLDRVGAVLVELFISFAALNAVKPSEPTLSTGIGRLLTQSRKGVPPHLDPTKVDKLIAEVRQKVELIIGTGNSKELHEKIRDRVSHLPVPADVVSGKDYLLPLFEHHLWSCTGRKTRRTSLRFRLARNCSLKRLEGLSGALAESRRRQTR